MGAQDETDQAILLLAYLREQLHFGNNGQTPSEWTDVKFYDLTSNYEKPGEIYNVDWSNKPGIFYGWTASDLAASVPAVAAMIYEIYGARTITKQVDEMLKFHQDPVWGYVYGLATEYQGPADLPIYGHGGTTYGAESQNGYIPDFEASVVVAANIGTGTRAQTEYVFCLAFKTAGNIILHPENDP